jgi:hypothetical protein
VDIIRAFIRSGAISIDAALRGAESGRGTGIEETVVPIGVVALMALGSPPVPHSILYSGGKNVLKPWIRFGLPAKSVETLSITPGVSMLKGKHKQAFLENRGHSTYAPLLKSFMMSIKRL